MRKGKISCKKQFLLFPKMFSNLYGTYLSFEMHFKMLSAFCFTLNQSKILSSGNGLVLFLFKKVTETLSGYIIWLYHLS